MKLNQIYHMDCNEYMKTLPDACVSLIIADPPYAITFKNQTKITRFYSTLKMGIKTRTF